MPSEKEGRTYTLWCSLLMSEPGPSNSDLCDLIELVHEPLVREEAAALLVGRVPTAGTLRFLNAHFPRYSPVAAATILEREPSNETLLFIASNFKSLSTRAVERVLQGKVSQEDLMNLFQVAPDFRSQIWQRIELEGASSENLAYLVSHREEFREPAAKMLLSMSPGAEDLLTVMANVPELREQAWAKFIEGEFTTAHLERVIRICNELAVRAGRVMLGLEPNRAELLFLLHWAPELYKEVGELLLQQPLKNHELRNLIMYEKDEEIQAKAAALLLDSDPSYVDLRAVFSMVTSLRNRAGKLLEQNTMRLMTELFDSEKVHMEA